MKKLVTAAETTETTEPKDDLKVIRMSFDVLVRLGQKTVPQKLLEVRNAIEKKGFILMDGGSKEDVTRQYRKKDLEDLVAPYTNR